MGYDVSHYYDYYDEIVMGNMDKDYNRLFNSDYSFRSFFRFIFYVFFVIALFCYFYLCINFALDFDFFQLQFRSRVYRIDLDRFRRINPNLHYSSTKYDTISEWIAEDESGISRYNDNYARYIADNEMRKNRIIKIFFMLLPIIIIFSIDIW